MILQYIFSMAISTNLLAMLLLFCVSVKFELALPISPSLHVSARLTILTWGGVKGRGRVKQAWPRLPRHLPKTQITHRV